MIQNDSPPTFDSGFRAELAALFAWRRDVRRFKPDPVDETVLRDCLDLACLAPSVGNSQPWRFVRVRDPRRRALVIDSFASCNQAALDGFSGEKRGLYEGLKLEGLREAPIHLAVYSDEDTRQGHGLGRLTMPETLRYSVVTAIHSFWLAARAHGLGVGWVSILDPATVTRGLDVPGSWHLIAYLCVGFPCEEHVDPELERLGWQRREAEPACLIER